MKTVEYMGYKYKIANHAGKPKVFKWSPDRDEWILSLNWTVSDIENQISIDERKIAKKENLEGQAITAAERAAKIADKAAKRKVLCRRATSYRAIGYTLKQTGEFMSISSSHVSTLVNEGKSMDFEGEL